MRETAQNPAMGQESAIQGNLETLRVCGWRYGEAKMVNKEKKYKWCVVDEPGNLEWIDKNQIFIDHRYQRDIVPSKVIELASSWSWIGCGVITIALRDGKYYVIDGQHRLEAAKKRESVKLLPCIVFKTPDTKTEAIGFLNSNGNRKPMTSYAKYRAELEAGDETAIFVNELLKKYSLTVAETDGTTSIRAIGRIKDLARLNKDKLSEVFNLCYRLCYPTHQITKIIVDVIDYINNHAENDGKGISDTGLAKRILALGPDAITAAATRSAAMWGRASIKIHAIGVLEAVNKNLHNRYSLDTRD